MTAIGLEEIEEQLRRARALLATTRTNAAMSAAPCPWEAKDALVSMGLAAEAVPAEFALFVFTNGAAAQAAARHFRSSFAGKPGHGIAGTNGALLLVGKSTSASEVTETAMTAIASAFAGDERDE